MPVKRERRPSRRPRASLVIRLGAHGGEGRSFAGFISDLRFLTLAFYFFSQFYRGAAGVELQKNPQTCLFFFATDFVAVKSRLYWLLIGFRDTVEVLISLQAGLGFLQKKM